jgi:hypothetical protein
MSPIRDFSVSQGLNPPVRNIDADAPAAMRLEVVDFIFDLAENCPNQSFAGRVYDIAALNLGQRHAANPYGGFKYAIGRDIQRVDWPKVYDLICRLWPEFCAAGLQAQYREGINRISAGYGIVWDLDSDGHLRRVLPQDAQAQIAAAIAELQPQHFEAALRLFNDARDAYDGIDSYAASI